MTPERWNRVQEIFTSALEWQPGHRSTFVEKACGGDAELAREVGSLLSSHDSAPSSFLESPPADAMQSVTMPAESGPALASGVRLGQYEILSPIGSGGMGQVYRARDRKLDRDVAIKVLPPQLNASREALSRFEREARAVATLSHPNILAIHDFGTQDGVSYAVMELLEGKTLRGMFDAGRLSRTEAVDYASQLVKGLVAAHERGIVHRDLKPENIFVSKDGHLKILDFGLAKREGQVEPVTLAGAPTIADHTQPGTVMGTIGYMFPEQVNGQSVDHRADVFSFGAILYEMLSGRRAFKKDTPAETMAAILMQAPPDPLEEPGRGSDALNHVVRRCLEKDRHRRFQSARDVASAMSEASPSAAGVARPARTAPGALIAVATLIAVMTAAGVFWSRRTSGKPTTGPKRIAVLPFENLGVPEDDYIADGIADAVRGRLARLPGVEVIARGSSTPYRKTTKTPQQIARELDVGYLLTATVRRQKGTEATNRVEVAPELVEVNASGAPTSKWQQPFDAPLTDVFQVQADIAARVARALGGALGAAVEKGPSEGSTQNLAAYDAFLRGEELWNSPTEGGVAVGRRALGFYEEAVALDPTFARAWARASLVNSGLYRVVPRPELAERARQAVEKAVALAPGLPEVYLSQGDYERMVVKDLSRALAEYSRGLRVAPENADLIVATASAEQSLGRWDAAVEHFIRAERLNPRSSDISSRLGLALARLKRCTEAREALNRGLVFAPADTNLIEYKAMTHLVEGDLAGARAVLASAPEDVKPTDLVATVAAVWDIVWLLDEQQRELLLRLTPSAFEDRREVWSICLADAYALKGDTANVRIYAEETRKVYEEQLRAAPDDAEAHALFGIALAYLGRKEEAIQEGKRSVALLPAKKEAWAGPYLQHKLALIYIRVGELEKAIDELEPLLKMPYFLSPGWLKIDPNFDPLRKNPRFQKLVAGAK